MDLRRELRNYWRDLFINGLVGSAIIPKQVRHHLLRLRGMEVGRCSIAPAVFFGSTRITIGDGSYVSYGCFFDALDRITIGRNCALAMGVTIATSTHLIGPPESRAGDSVRAPVSIGDGCWIGANVTILPGVTVGAGTVVAAGSLVREDCAPDSVYAGIPAKRIGPASSQT